MPTTETMDENRLRFGVGVLVISAIGIGIILTFLFGAFPSVLNRDYTLLVDFPSAEGIGANSPVVRDGVRIGRVADIQLQDTGGVLVTLAMDSSKPLTRKYIPRIGSGNIVTGDAKLEFVSATQAELESFYESDPGMISSLYGDGDYFKYGKKSKSLFEMQNELQDTFSAIRDAGQAIQGAGESVNQLAIEVQRVVGGADSKVDQVADEAVKTLQDFQGALQDVRQIFGNPELKANLEKSLAAMPELLLDAQAALDSTQKTFESFERVGIQFEKVGVAAEETVGAARDAVGSAQQTVDNLEQFTEPLAERGDEIVEKLLNSLVSLDNALVQVEIFGKSLNNSNGTVKRLVEDDEIYYQVRRTLENVEQASAKIRPILDDVRIFSDKIARDPRELGVRGALGKRPSGSGFK